MYVSPTEPAVFHALGKLSMFPEEYGADFSFVANGLLHGVQRKEVKDLIASAEDGRIAKQSILMARLDVAWVVIEGTMKFTLDGALIGKQYGRSWTRENVWGLLASLSQSHRVVHTESARETVDWLRYVQTWAKKDRHDSLSRKGSASSPIGGTPNHEDIGAYLLQSLPGIGPEMARRIYRHFGKVPWGWECTVEQLQEIDGIGKKRAEKMMKTLGVA